MRMAVPVGMTVPVPVLRVLMVVGVRHAVRIDSGLIQPGPDSGLVLL